MQPAIQRELFSSLNPYVGILPEWVSHSGTMLLGTTNLTKGDSKNQLIVSFYKVVDRGNKLLRGIDEEVVIGK